ncbi:hypothetical protein Tco_1338469 [Tanacetum coccineum]
MEQMTSLCDMVGQIMQKKEEERRIAEEQAAKDRYRKIPICYDDDDDNTLQSHPSYIPRARDRQLRGMEDVIPELEDWILIFFYQSTDDNPHPELGQSYNDEMEDIFPTKRTQSTGYSLKDKNKAKPDKIEHEIGKSTKNRGQGYKRIENGAKTEISRSTRQHLCI